MLFAAAIIGSLTASARAEESRSSGLKAAVLYNFAHFVEWPSAAFPNRTSPIVIGIFGDDPFGPTLDGLVARERVDDRKLVVIRTRDLEQACRCHMLFVSESERSHTPELFTKLQNKPVLTVADYDGFVRSGGMVLMHEYVGERIQVRVHLAAIHAAHLNLSGKLLRVAEVITPEQD